MNKRLTASLLTLCLTQTVQANQSLQSLESIQLEVEDYLLSRLYDGSNNIELNVNPIDPRLKLRECDEALNLDTGRVNSNSRRVAVKVSCQRPKRWKIYVTAQVEAWRDVLTVKNPISRGHIINPLDVTLERKRVQGLGKGHLNEIDQISGMEARVSLRPGMVIAPHHFVLPTLIKRGQNVTLQAFAGGIAVSMDGKALNNARAGERVRVKNNSSGRIVEGMTTELGTVKIGHQ